MLNLTDIKAKRQKVLRIIQDKPVGTLSMKKTEYTYSSSMDGFLSMGCHQKIQPLLVN